MLKNSNKSILQDSFSYVIFFRIFYIEIDFPPYIYEYNFQLSLEFPIKKLVSILEKNIGKYQKERQLIFFAN